jgi:hypothetical protein
MGVGTWRVVDKEAVSRLYVRRKIYAHVLRVHTK